MRLLIIMIAFLVLSACGNVVENNKDMAKEMQKEEPVEETKEEPLAEIEEESLIKEEEKSNEERGEEEKELEPEYKINPNNWRVEPLDQAPANVLLLTIDDAPDKHGAEMARILRDLDVSAIFFVNGHFIQSEKGKQQLKEISDLGHQIGNHTMTHANLSKLSEEEQRKEIIALNDLIEQELGFRPRFFRAPFGVNTDISKKIAKEEGMEMMNWSYGYDFVKKYMETEPLVHIMTNAPELSDGANLLMHDRSFTKDALVGIVKGLQEKGYTFVNPNNIK